MLYNSLLKEKGATCRLLALKSWVKMQRIVRMKELAHRIDKSARLGSIKSANKWQFLSAHPKLQWRREGLI